MKKPIFSKLKGILTAMCLVGLVLILAVSGNPVKQFYAFVLSSMVINFFCYQRKQNTWFFYLPLGSGCLMMFFAVLSFIGWIAGQPVFIGFWSKLFGLNALIISMASVFYALMLLDEGIRQDLKESFSFKRRVAH